MRVKWNTHREAGNVVYGARAAIRRMWEARRQSVVDSQEQTLDFDDDPSSMCRVLKEVFGLPVDLIDNDAAMLYEAVRDCGRSRSSVTIRVVEGL